jgi:hypothetical protein
MIQIKRKRFLPTILITATLALVLTTVGAPQRAEACGGSYLPPTDTQLVQATIVRHLKAITQGDSKAVKANWSQGVGRSTTLVSAGGVDKVRTLKIGTASRRWARNTDGKMKWNIEKMDVDQNAASAKLSITWHGQKRIEYLTLLKVNGTWTLVGKVHVAAGPQPVGPKAVSLN